jgi:hypothetical protein
MKVSAANDRTWALPDPDTYAAVCIRQIDLGTQENKQFGKIQRKVKFIWELIGTQNVFDESKGPEPFIVSKEYTVAFGDTANLRKDVESWINRALTEEEQKDFDLAILLGTPCFITVTHSDDNKYANISSVTAPMKGYVVNAPENEVFDFNIGEIGWEDVFSKLFEGEKKKIMLSPEYKAAIAGNESLSPAAKPVAQGRAVQQNPGQVKPVIQPKPGVKPIQAKIPTKAPANHLEQQDDMPF